MGCIDDATNIGRGGGDETASFRFLRLPQPDASGTVTIDFTRAFLPPCMLSDHDVCPLPSSENRLEVAVRAGERMPIYR